MSGGLVSSEVLLERSHAVAPNFRGRDHGDWTWGGKEQADKIGGINIRIS